MIVPVILCGGAGVRLWPLSRKSMPKQHLKIFGEQSLLFNTMIRALKHPEISSLVLVSDESSRFLVQEEIESVKKAGVKADFIHIVEPLSRNTAPAIALAALEVNKRYGAESKVLVLPADHLITDTDAFIEAIDLSLPAVNDDKIITWGVQPKWVETGYGYIEKSENLTDRLFRVKSFKEKPSESVAESYVSSGDYLWNSGVFFMKALVYINELNLYQKDMCTFVKKAHATIIKDLNFLKIDKDSYSKCKSDSIDYAIMEHTKLTEVLSVDFEWDDVGSWSSVWKCLPKDKENNVLIGNVKAVNCKSSLLIGTKKHLSVVVDLQDSCYVQTENATLILPRSKSQNLKTYLKEILDQSLDGFIDTHQRVYRPWGFYESLDIGSNYQIKRILVKPRGKLSLQSHLHRAEHWVVISGVATVVKGESTFKLKTNESTFISKEEKHRLENQGDDLLEIIEIQTGSYLGEDDIIRYEDVYGRSN